MSSLTNPHVEISSASPSWPRRMLLGVVGGAAFGAAYGPLLVEFFKNLWSRPHYQHFPFVLAAFGWLLARRLSEAEPTRRAAGAWRPGAATIALVAVAWGVLGLAYGRSSPWLAFASLMTLTAGALVEIQRTFSVRGLWGVWALLWLILPPPVNRDQALIALLQRVSSRVSSFVLETLGVLHLMEGNLLLLPEKHFFVDQACSGIISVLSIVACAMIYGVWRRHSAIHVVALIVAGVGWATLMNTLRISVIALAFDKWGIDWSVGTPHEALSLCVFLLTFLALISTDVVLQGLFEPIAVEWETAFGTPVRWGRALVWLWDKGAASDRPVDPMADEAHVGSLRAAWASLTSPRFAKLVIGAAAAFAALPTWHYLWAQSGTDAPGSVGPTLTAEACIERALACGENLLPEEIGDLRREQFTAEERDRDDLMGNYSRSYLYRGPDGATFLVSCDFPYQGGWHELTVCYQGIGWNLQDRRVIERKGTNKSDDWPRMEARFSKPDGVRAFLAVSAFDETGSSIDLPTLSFWEDSWNALQGRDVYSHQVAFQVQVWRTSAAPISAEERKTARRLLFLARERFREAVARGGEPGAVAGTESNSN